MNGLILLRCVTFQLLLAITIKQVYCKDITFISDYACFNTVFEITCDDNEVIVFETARYGRNDTTIAPLCGVPFTRNCDVDVHFLMNRACSGRIKCALVINTALFGDPCGYEEFLKVSYRCVRVSNIHNQCTDNISVNSLHGSGYITTPNYPEKYFMDAVCFWKISVGHSPYLRITIFDFELDVKRAGRCQDYLEIFSSKENFFHDCGSVGKQTIELWTNHVTVKFLAGPSSLTHRGSFLYFEGFGGNCNDLMLHNGNVAYFWINDVYNANVTCHHGYALNDDLSFIHIQCIDFSWSYTPNCTLLPTSSIRYVNQKDVPFVTPKLPTVSRQFPLVKSASVFGVILGIVISFLLIIFLFTLALYFYKRRRRAEHNLEKWKIIISNLQDNIANEDNDKYRQCIHNTMSDYSLRRIKHYNNGSKMSPDEMECNANLLSIHNPSDTTCDHKNIYGLVPESIYNEPCLQRSRQSIPRMKRSCKSNECHLNASTPVEQETYLPANCALCPKHGTLKRINTCDVDLEMSPFATSARRCNRLNSPYRCSYSAPDLINDFPFDDSRVAEDPVCVIHSTPYSQCKKPSSTLQHANKNRRNKRDSSTTNDYSRCYRK